MQEIACESRRNGGRAQAVIEQCVGRREATQRKLL
jgi:hypothetical protein